MENKPASIIDIILNEFKTTPIEEINSYLRCEGEFSERGFRLKDKDENIRASIFIRERNYMSHFSTEKKQKGINLCIGNGRSSIEYNELLHKAIQPTYNEIQEKLQKLFI